MQRQNEEECSHYWEKFRFPSTPLSLTEGLGLLRAEERTLRSREGHGRRPVSPSLVEVWRPSPRCCCLGQRSCCCRGFVGQINRFSTNFSVLIRVDRASISSRLICGDGIAAEIPSLPGNSFFPGIGSDDEESSACRTPRLFESQPWFRNSCFFFTCGCQTSAIKYIGNKKRQTWKWDRITIRMTLRVNADLFCLCFESLVDCFYHLLI